MKRQSPKRKDDVLSSIIMERIKKIRYQHNYTQEFVIEHTGLDISSLESGRTAPTLVSICILCKLYNITLDEFFTGITYPEKK